MLLNIIQIPLSDKEVFVNKHLCVECKMWDNYGSLTYLDKYEETKFVCKDCQSDGFQQIPLPKQTIFRKKHKCIECTKFGDKGVLTYCIKCEESEFVCPICHIIYFEDVNPNQRKLDPMR